MNAVAEKVRVRALGPQVYELTAEGEFDELTAAQRGTPTWKTAVKPFVAWSDEAAIRHARARLQELMPQSWHPELAFFTLKKKSPATWAHRPLAWTQLVFTEAEATRLKQGCRQGERAKVFRRKVRAGGAEVDVFVVVARRPFR